MPLKVTDTPEYSEAWQTYCMNYKGMVSAKHVHAFAAGLQKFVELTENNARSELVSHVVIDERSLCDDPQCKLHHASGK